MKQRYLTFLMPFISLSLIFSSAPVTAQSIYRWTDAQGRVHFSNAPVSAATAVDDELPPATSFGGMQDSSPSPLQAPTSAEQQPDTQRSTAALSPDQEEADGGADSANNEKAAATEQEPFATTEAAGAKGERPEGEDSDVESLPQASVDFSEREEPGTQTAASENQRSSLLDADEDQPAPETRDAEEENEKEDEDKSEDSEDIDDNGNEDEPAAVEGNS